MNLSRQQLTFMTLVFLVLLRTVIGWHFLYEGIVKIESHRAAINPWTSKWYLNASTGPFAPIFKSISDPDPFALESVNPHELETRWREEVERWIRHYDLEPAQVRILEASAEEAIKALDDYYQEKENWKRFQVLRQEVADWQEASSADDLLTHERNELAVRRNELEDMRDEVGAPIRETEARLWEHAKSILTPEQAALGPPPERVDILAIADQITMWGLALVGLLMMLGLFSRLSALGAAGFLTLFYLAIPPWPGLPEVPPVEGNYLIVNKNLVELFACLVLVMIPTGKWVGIDALISRLCRRRRKVS